MANGDPNADENFETVKLPNAKKLKEVQMHKAMIACVAGHRCGGHRFGKNGTAVYEHCS